MKRYFISILLVFSLLVSICVPVFATEEATEPTPSEIEATAEEMLPSEEAESVEQNLTPEKREPSVYNTSPEGIAFITEFMGKNPAGTQQLLDAEGCVNGLMRAGVTLSQTQFDALVDFVMEKGTGIFSAESNYRVRKVLVDGYASDAEFADAYCAWVKNNAGSFSQMVLDRRIRQVKLFLYGSYDGVCDAQFRYVIFYPQGGTLIENTVMCYPLYATYGNLPTATKGGSYFAGWHTAASGGNHLCNSDTVEQNMSVYAHWSNTEIANPNEPFDGDIDIDPAEWPELPTLKTSEACIQFIKEHEGMAPTPMWDYAQYSVGYGSRYDVDHPENNPIQISNPITEEEADYLLRYSLAYSSEPGVNGAIKKANFTHNQAQYDALVSITYNLGLQWVGSSYSIYKYIMGAPYGEMEFVNSLGSWCNAGGQVLHGLCMRRMEEAELYLHGDYVRGSCRYRCIVFNPAGGTATDKVEYYRAGSTINWLPTASREGYIFQGWFTKAVGGTEVNLSTAVPSALTTTVYAHWEEGVDENPPIDPPKPPEPPVPPEPDPVEAFTDVKPSDWFYDWVRQAVKQKLFQGMGETEFNPNGTMSRAMLVTVLHRMSGAVSEETATQFTDVPQGSWYAKAVAWAASNGIVFGITETTFEPEALLTREQLVTMLWRYANMVSPDAVSQVAGDLSGFPDAASVMEYAKEAVRWAVAMGIITGDGGRLMPQGNATRAQCAKILVVFIEKQ